MPSSWDRWSLTAAAAGVWLPGLFLLRYVAHSVSGRNGSGASALIGFFVAFLLCLVVLRLVWWLPYRGVRAWIWTSVVVLCSCGAIVWIATALSNSITADIGNDLIWSALWGLVSGAPIAAVYGALGGFLIGVTARAGGALGGQSQRPWVLAVCSGLLFLAGAGGVAYFVLTDVWPGPS